MILRSPVFTAREKAVLRLLVDGYTIEEAAERLEMALATVEQHLADVHSKLGSRHLRVGASTPAAPLPARLWESDARC
jgi:DNA-binding NarL/FixJ family response regulator